MNESDRFNDKDLGNLGALLSRQVSGIGPVPEADELWNWMHGECEPGRADEIRSHLAADEDLYDLWQALRGESAAQPSTFQNESLDNVDAGTGGSTLSGAVPDRKNTTDSFFSWFSRWPAGAIAYGALAVMLMIVVLPHTGSPVAQHPLWQHWRLPKTVPDELTSNQFRFELQPFLVGVREALLDIDARPVGPENRQLPMVSPACPDAEIACLQRQEQLFRLGNITTATVYQCVTGGVVSVPEPLLEIASVVSSRPILAPFDSPLSDWIAADDQMREQICSASSTLLNRALGAMKPLLP